ncbi:hypothetical protein [Limimaricola cinnabarinus]|uniref:Uncharacterized protein n=1 Tax=Limimaricola cinnabarinus TaxID=1125964 RepID=A0A2G1MFI8_9RHOB|nr:hypothetical protein [Limimaricola cinnabarinus]PHP27519.1 hypothetical protein CJ301_10180 [Limimaricola cinnabarinus]
MTQEQKRPSPNTCWIMSSRDLPRKRHDGWFRVTKADGSESVIVLRKRKRQMLEALMRSHVYCASPVRLSDVVNLLRHNYGIDIETVYFEEDHGDDVTRYGVYVLADKVEYIERRAALEVAA